MCLTETVRDGKMAYICGSSIYVSLHVSGVYTTIHIRQHLDGMEETTGKTQIKQGQTGNLHRILLI